MDDKKKKLEDMQKGFLKGNTQSVRDKMKKIVPFGGTTPSAEGRPNSQYENKKQRPYGRGY